MRNEERERYIIPKNFLDSGYVFGGRFKLRNFIEASAITAPFLAVFIIGWKYLGWSVVNTLAACVIVCAAVFLACVKGVAGDSLFEFLARVKKFKETKQIAKYNPRVKLENEPDYLMVQNNSLPREKILQLGKNIANKFIGEDMDTPISKDISDNRLITYFEDDDGIIEKPEPLKTRAELRADAKKARMEERNRRREEKAFLKSLPAKERKERKKEFRLEARIRRAEALRVANEQKAENDRRVKEVLEQAEKKKAELYQKRQEELQKAKMEKKAVRAAEKQKKKDERIRRREAKKNKGKKAENIDVLENCSMPAQQEVVGTQQGYDIHAESDGSEPTQELSSLKENPQNSEEKMVNITHENVLAYPEDIERLFESDVDEFVEETNPNSLIDEFELTFLDEVDDDDATIADIMDL